VGFKRNRERTIRKGGDFVPKVKDVMTNEVVSVAPSALAIDVAQKILVSGQRVIPVCDNGELRGMVTERDIVVGIVATARDPVEVAVNSLAGNHSPIIAPGDDILLAARLMVNRNARVLPVVENGKLVGLLTLDDLARESPALAAMVFCKTVNPAEHR
jgi:CBS domain-containing protein